MSAQAKSFTNESHLVAMDANWKSLCKLGGSILILLSVALLLFGGGIFPPLIGVIGGVAGTRINKPLTGSSTWTLYLNLSHLALFFS
jgi:hypothetical protein